MPDSIPDSPHDRNDDSYFAELVARFFNGPLEDGDLTALRSRLETDPAARQLFVQVARLDGLLTERSLESKQALSIGTDFLEQPSGEDPSNLSMDDATVQAAIREEDVNFPADESVELPSYPASGQAVPQGLLKRNAPLIIKVTSIAAVLLLVVGVATRLLKSPVQPQAGNPPVAISPAPLPPAVVLLGAAVRAEWESTTPPLPGGWISDQPLALKSGWVRLDFPSGTTAIIEAPARFRLPSNMQINLELGHVAARVTAQGHGFTVESPSCRVVDFGTDFGVAVAAHGQSDVQVFQGKVSFSPATAGTHTDAGVSEFLTQGEGRRIESPGGPVIKTVADKDAFVRLAQFNRWAGTQDSTLDQWRTFNEQLSREPGLSLFYSMNEADQALLKNHAVSTAGQYDLPTGSTHAPTWVQGRMPGIRALNFDTSRQQYLVLPTCPMTQTGQLSCAVWVYARSYVDYGSILKNWGDQKCGAFHLGLAGATHCLEVQLDGTRPDGPNVHENDPFPLGQWVHVAFVSDGSVVRLYRDGKEVASGPSRPIQNNPPITSMAIGCKTADDGVTPIGSIAAGFWDGQIGEIALFDRALTPQEIQQLSQQGRH